MIKLQDIIKKICQATKEHEIKKEDIANALEKLQNQTSNPKETAKTQQPEFTETALRENLTAGEFITTLFGKIRKWFSDLLQEAILIWLIHLSFLQKTAS